MLEKGVGNKSTGLVKIEVFIQSRGICSGAVDWDTALHVGRPWVRFPMVFLEFHWHNFSGRTMALGLIQPLTEMSTRNNSWWVKVAGAWGRQSYHFHMLIVLKSGSLNLLEPLGLSRPVMGLLLHRVNEKWNILRTIKKGGLVPPCAGTAF
jgi:hypothetical protein